MIPAYQLQAGDVIAVTRRVAPDALETVRRYVVAGVRFISADRLIVTTRDGVELVYNDDDPIDVAVHQ